MQYRGFTITDTTGVYEIRAYGVFLTATTSLAGARRWIDASIEEVTS